MDSTSPLHPALRLLDELADEPVGSVVSKALVFDRLLDLRNLMGAQPPLVDMIDQRLREVPGATMAPGAWWQSELLTLRAALGDALCPEGIS